MINPPTPHPQPLTPKAGFVEGVVVRFQTIEGKTYCRELLILAGERLVFNDDTGIDLEVIKSIRPLTGPMAIWNFAPEWAEELMIWPFGERLEWHREGDERKTIGGNVQFIKRPWWAKESGE